MAEYRGYNLSRPQLEALIQQMSVLNGNGTFHAWEITPEQGFLKLYFIDDPDVATIDERVVDLTPVIPVAPLPVPPAFTVTSITPTTIASGGPPFVLRVFGTNFHPPYEILLDGSPAPAGTIYVSYGELYTIVTPPGAPGTIDVQVRLQDVDTLPSTPITLTVT